MVERKKRLEKGIDSLGEQIEKHELKLDEARKNLDADLEGYYRKEIEALKKVKERKEKQLGKD